MIFFYKLRANEFTLKFPAFLTEKMSPRIISLLNLLGHFCKLHFIVDYFATHVTYFCETIFIQARLDIASCFCNNNYVGIYYFLYSFYMPYTFLFLSE